MNIKYTRIYWYGFRSMDCGQSVTLDCDNFDGTL